MKISDLPLQSEPTGAETVLILDEGVAKRVPLAPLVAAATPPQVIEEFAKIVKPVSSVGYAGGFADKWGRYLALIELDGLLRFGRVRMASLFTLAVTVAGSTLTDGAPAGWAHVWRDPLGRIMAGMKNSGAFAAPVLTDVRSINGKPIESILSVNAKTAKAIYLDAEINLFVWYGQSKPAGTDSLPVLTNAPLYDGLRFNGGVRPYDTAVTPRASFAPLIETVNGSLGETPASAMEAALKQRLLLDYNIAPADRPYQMLMTCQARGGTAIDGLKVGTQPHNDIKADFNAMRMLAKAAGKSSKFRGFAWSQGESDYAANTSAAYYRTTLIAIRSDLDAHAKAANPANGDVICFIDQVFAHATYGHANDPYLALEQLAICRDTDGFVMVGNFAHLPQSSYPHWTNRGSQWAGCYYLRAYQRVVVDRGIWKALEPVDAYRDGKVIMARFEPESGELRFDTATIPDQGNKGFSLGDAGGAVITSVELLGKDTVKITCDRNVPAGAKLRTGEGASGATNLRDTMGDTIKMTIGNDTYIMHNWCLITSTTLA